METVISVVKKTSMGGPIMGDRPRTADPWRGYAHRRLSEVFERTPVVPFDHRSRIVLMSDCHRGDNSRADAFAANEVLYLQALDYYYHEGYTYIEVGDGDELWKNRRFSDVQREHGKVFDQLRRFHQQGRLHLLFGNHDIAGRKVPQVEKDGLIARESLILRHARSGLQILVLHGHQADFQSDRLSAQSRFIVRNIGRKIQLLGLNPEPLIADSAKIEQRLRDWTQRHGQALICGHTHKLHWPAEGAPLYFNTGSCIHPGVITGIEIASGEIVPVRWFAERNGPTFRRELLTPPRNLLALS